MHHYITHIFSNSSQSLANHYNTIRAWDPVRFSHWHGHSLIFCNPRLKSSKIILFYHIKRQKISIFAHEQKGIMMKYIKIPTFLGAGFGISIFSPFETDPISRSHLFRISPIAILVHPFLLTSSPLQVLLFAVSGFLKLQLPLLFATSLQSYFWRLYGL